MNAQQIVDDLLGDESSLGDSDVASIATAAIRQASPYGPALSVYRRVLSETGSTRKAWEAVFYEAFGIRGTIVSPVAFALDIALSELRNLGLNENPRQVEQYVDYVVEKEVRKLYLPVGHLEAVKALWRRLAIE